MYLGMFIKLIFRVFWGEYYKLLTYYKGDTFLVRIAVNKMSCFFINS